MGRRSPNEGLNTSGSCKLDEKSARAAGHPSPRNPSKKLILLGIDNGWKLSDRQPRPAGILFDVSFSRPLKYREIGISRKKSVRFFLKTRPLKMGDFLSDFRLGLVEPSHWVAHRREQPRCGPDRCYWFNGKAEKRVPRL